MRQANGIAGYESRYYNDPSSMAAAGKPSLNYAASSSALRQSSIPRLSPNVHSSSGHHLSGSAFQSTNDSGKGGLTCVTQNCAGVPWFTHAGGLNDNTRTHSRHREVKDNFVAKVVEKYAKAIVLIETERNIDVDMEADIFSFFFGQKKKSESSRKTLRAHGSGFCIDGGVVLTNAHVIADADVITVSFPDGQTCKARLLGKDEIIDLAALQLDKQRCATPIPLGNSSGLKVGDWSIVLGHPLGLNNTVTLGIISSLNRSSGETGWDWMRHALIQTDAAVNQGNSGGPLLNELGQCVGIISMRALFGEGIGFAIPIDGVKNALPNLLQRKSVPHSYLGIKMQSQKSTKGLRIDSVLRNSPADLAGILVGDVITELNGARTNKMEEVQTKVREAPLGKEMRFKLQRGDTSVSATVKTADAKELKDSKEKKNKDEKPNTRIIMLP